MNVDMNEWLHRYSVFPGTQVNKLDADRYFCQSHSALVSDEMEEKEPSGKGATTLDIFSDLNNQREFTSNTLESVDSRDLVALVVPDWSDGRMGESAAPKSRCMGDRTVLTQTPLILLLLRASWEAERAFSRLRERD